MVSASKSTSLRREIDYDWSEGEPTKPSVDSKSESTSKQKAHSSRSRRKNIRRKSTRETQRKESNRTRSSSASSSTNNDSNELQVDAIDNPSVVFQCINYGDWSGAASRIKSHPKEASTWVVRREPVDYGTHDDNKRSDEKGIKWRYLPLHLACLQRNPPTSLVKALLQAYPDAASRRDQAGNLPIHHLCHLSGGAHPIVLKLLVDAYPECSQKKNSRRRTAVDILTKKVKDGTFSRSSVKRALNILERKRDTQNDFNDIDETRDDDTHNKTSNNSSNESIGSSEWYMSDEEEVRSMKDTMSNINAANISRLQKQMHQIQGRLDRVTAERDMLRKAVLRMEQQQDQQEKQLVAATNEKDEHIDELMDTITALEDRAIDADDLRYQVIDLLDQIDITSQENSELGQENDLILKQLDELGHQLAEQEEAFGEKLAEQEAAFVERLEEHEHLFEDQFDAAREDIMMKNQQVENGLVYEIEELKSERDSLSDLLTAERMNNAKAFDEHESRCKQLEEELDECQEDKDILKKELQKTIEERNELQVSIEAVKREAKVDASNAKAAFNAKQTALRDEIQSIWSLVQSVQGSSSSPGPQTKKGGLMHSLEIGDNHNQNGDIGENVNNQLQKQHRIPDKKEASEEILAAASSILETEETVSAISDNYAWSEGNDEFELKFLEEDEGKNVPLNVTGDDNESTEKWLAQFNSEVKLLEEESKALLHALDEVDVSNQK